MILYHNADYKDLPSILKDGILPMSETVITDGITKREPIIRKMSFTFLTLSASKIVFFSMASAS